jgi:hypothetical protein
MQDVDYYGALEAALDDELPGFVEALLDEELIGFNRFKAPPMTLAKMAMTLATRGKIEDFALNCLKLGNWPGMFLRKDAGTGGVEAIRQQWETSEVYFSRKELYQAFQAWLKHHHPGTRYTPNKNDFIREVAATLGFDPKNVSTSRWDAHYGKAVDAKGPKLPLLAKCREAFAKHVGVDVTLIDWDDADPLPIYGEQF